MCRWHKTGVLVFRYSDIAVTLTIVRGNILRKRGQLISCLLRTETDLISSAYCIPMRETALNTCSLRRILARNRAGTDRSSNQEEAALSPEGCGRAGSGRSGPPQPAQINSEGCGRAGSGRSGPPQHGSDRCPACP